MGISVSFSGIGKKLFLNTSDSEVHSVSRGSAATPGVTFEIDDFSFDIEQVLNIGSQSSGVGSGKVSFNPFQITKKTDVASSLLLNAAALKEIFASLQVKFTSSDSTGRKSPYYVVTLMNASIVSVKPSHHSGKSPRSGGLEEITLAFRGITVQNLGNKKSRKDDWGG